MTVRGRSHTLPLPERKLVRAMMREHMKIKQKIATVTEQLLELMEQRDDLLAEADKTCPRSVAKKFDLTHSQVTYLCRLRGGMHGKSGMDGT